MIDVGVRLEKVEAAAPIDAVEAVVERPPGHDRRLARRTCLIADFSGRSLVRLTSDSPRRRRPAPGPAGAGRDAAARRHALRPGAPNPAARTSRALGGRRPDDGSGDRPGRRDRAAGAGPAAPPDAGGGRRHRRRGARPRLRGHRRPTAHRRLRVGPAHHAVRAGRRDPAAAAPASYTCEAGQFTLAGWLEPASRSAGTPSTTRSTATPSRCRSPTPWATRWPRPCWPPSSSAASATGAGRGSTSPNRPGTPTTRWPRTPRPASSSPGR